MELTEGLRIEVEQRAADEKFVVGDLQVWHAGCTGVIALEVGGPYVNLTCHRCGSRTALSLGEDGTGGLVATAVDGKERTLSGDIQVTRRGQSPKGDRLDN